MSEPSRYEQIREQNARKSEDPRYRESLRAKSLIKSLSKEADEILAELHQGITEICALLHASIEDSELSVGSTFRVYYIPETGETRPPSMHDPYNYNAVVTRIDNLGEAAGIYCRLERDDGEFQTSIHDPSVWGDDVSSKMIKAIQAKNGRLRNEVHQIRDRMSALRRYHDALIESELA